MDDEQNLEAPLAADEREYDEGFDHFELSGAALHYLAEAGAS